MATPSDLRRDLIVIGGSAGALEALRTLFSRLPSDLPAAILVTVHIPADFPSILPELLKSWSAWPAVHPSGSEPLQHGKIYVAPPDFHLRLQDGSVELSRGPRENRHRPAIDVLFRTAARSYGRRVIGVVLSGQLDDGSSGLMAIRMRGGTGIVQDPADALSSQMPTCAIQYAGADYVVGVTQIPDLLNRLTREPLLAAAPEANLFTPDGIEEEAEVSTLEGTPVKHKHGKPSAFACPECSGVLWELEEGELLRFRCRVGHAYTADALRVALSDHSEDALWAAMRALEEKAALLLRMSTRVQEWLSRQYKDEAEAMEKHAVELRRILLANQELAEKQADTSDAA